MLEGNIFRAIKLVVTGGSNVIHPPRIVLATGRERSYAFSQRVANGYQWAK